MDNPPNNAYFNYTSYFDKVEAKDKILCDEAWDNFAKKYLTGCTLKFP